MIKYFENNYGYLINGNSTDEIKNIPDKSVQSIITSPPYWALRDYGNNNQIGLEDTFEEYLSKLITVFNDCKRVLKDDGLLFVNLSDTYSGTGIKNNHYDPKNKGRNIQGQSKNEKTPGVKRKSLIGIPQRFMIAMIDSGWICRNTIIWHKPNAMPESVKDRFTVDYEYIFMFSKSRFYKFNQIKEPMKTKDRYQAQKGISLVNKHSSLISVRGSKGVLGTLNQGNRKDYSEADYEKFSDKYKNDEDFVRNKRTVWSINTKGTKEAHFAIFPGELIENLILCSTDPGDVTFDPFMGSGTVAKEAEVNNRKWIGIELNTEYCEIIKRNLSIIQPKLF